MARVPPHLSSTRPDELDSEATSSFSGEWKDAPPPEIHIAYKVLELFPRGRRVLISCHAPQGHPPLNYSLWGSGGIEVARKLVVTRAPASFSVNITLKSRPDLLTYSCQLAGPGRVHATSTELQMYWELWTKPVSQLRADFTLQDGGAGAQVLVSCQASTGSPPITYSLVGKDGRVHLQQAPSHGQPARFSLPMTQTPNWFQCRAENGVSADSSPLTLVPPGLLPQVPTAVLAGSLISIAAVTSGMLGWAWRTR
ncbi:protein IL-40 [Sorex fumeus]|uniref:protein IL-40 n=1 Tax=Sorex fumeus TaxID=62283 RepID=UPI0024AD825D|nr:protein IL-40 [Sorex fumeus]